MSDAMKRLDEIEARLKAAPPEVWTGFNDTEGRLVIEGRRVWDLVRHARADLALLLKATRAYQEWGERVIAHCEAMNFNTREEEWIAEEFEEIRRELAGGVR